MRKGAEMGEIQKIELGGVGRLKYHVFLGDEQVPPYVELLSIFVEPKLRRQGYGSALMVKLANLAKKEGIGCIYIRVTRQNMAFQKFLEKNGFEVSPTKTLYQRRVGTMFSAARKFSRFLARCTIEKTKP